MNIAIFFQKKHTGIFAIMKILYIKFFLRSNKKRIKYLRDSGAVIGENVHIGSVGILGSEPWLVSIGDNCYFSGGETKLFTHDGGIERLYYMGIMKEKKDVFGRIKIGSNCFIGADCIILRGVTIGDNCIIGAGSIVTKDIPSDSVACGVPAKAIKSVYEYYEGNKGELHPTLGMNTFKKRLYCEENNL